MRIKFKNFLGTIESFFRNDATTARTYQFQDRNGTIADDTDLGLKVDKTTTVNGNALSGNVTLTKSDIGLSSVDNTTDANKPISSATQSALDAKEDETNKVSSVGSGSATEYPNTNAVKSYTTGTQDIWVGSGAMWPRTTNGCADLAKTEMATSLVNIQTLDFDQTTQEFANFLISLPRNYNNGTVTAKVYWTAAAGSGTVQWGISGGAYSNDDALTVALGTAQTADDTLIATGDLHISPETSAITLAGTPADADFLAFQISRNVASDTLTGDAKLLGIILTITTDAATAS